MAKTPIHTPLCTTDGLDEPDSTPRMLNVYFDNNELRRSVNLDDACAVSPYFRALVQHATWDRRSASMGPGSGILLQIIGHMIKRYAKKDKPINRLPTPLPLGRLSFIGRNDPYSCGFLQLDRHSTNFGGYVNNIWGNGSSGKKQVFYDTMRVLQYIQWNEAYEFMCAHLAMVMMRYENSYKILLARAIDPDKDTLEPSRRLDEPDRETSAAKRSRHS